MAVFPADKLQAIKAVAVQFAFNELTENPGIFMSDQQIVINTLVRTGASGYTGLPMIGKYEKGETDENDSSPIIEQVREAIKIAFKNLPKTKPKVEHDSSKQGLDYKGATNIGMIPKEVKPEPERRDEIDIFNREAIYEEQLRTIGNENESKAEKAQAVSAPAPKPPEPEQKKAVPVKTCFIKTCGIELSMKRAMECFDKDPQEPVFICEECEAKKPELKEGKDMNGHKPVNTEAKKTEDNTLVAQTPHKDVSIIRPLTQAQIIEAATLTAKLLADVVEKAKLYSMISGKKYTRVEGWETLGALLLCSSEIIKTEEYKNGYKSEAVIRNQEGKVISNGIGICLKSEKNWATRDDFAICSMSQTRAIGKAYRLSFAWIMSLAGYEVCPVEEME